MSLEIGLVIWGILLVFIGMSWGMWELYKKLEKIEKTLESMI